MVFRLLGFAANRKNRPSQPERLRTPKSIIEAELAEIRHKLRELELELMSENSTSQAA
ncbi:MAG TPA: hypothetical protein VFP40_01335 [Terriglobales bacterium]|jgi:hypothetical protein|nr:hypothetical protein [Terriglobales bacterium]